MFITGGNGIVNGKFSNVSIDDYNTTQTLYIPSKPPVDNKYIAEPFLFNVNTNNVNKFRIYWSNNNQNIQNLNLTEILINNISNPVTLDTSNNIIKRITNYVNGNDRTNFYENLNSQSNSDGNNFGHFLYDNNADIDITLTEHINLYKLARDGIIKEFTGISDPFEESSHADTVISGVDLDNDIHKIMNLM